MRVLLTGATGLIGMRLTQELLEAGHQVTALTRDPQRAAARLPAAVRPLPWDGQMLGDWSAALEETDAIVHLAGESIAGERAPAIFLQRWTAERRERIRASRVESGRLLVAAIRRAARRPAVFLQASAVGYYGPRSSAVDENAPPGDDFLAQVCRQWEASTRELESLGLRRVVLRTGLVLAADGGILPLMLLPIRLGLGGRLGSGRQGVSWIHVDDEAAAIRFLLEEPAARGAYNLTAPQPLSQADFVRTAGALLRRPVWLPAPAWGLRLALGQKADLVLAGQYALPARLQAAGFRFRFPQLEAALRDLLRL